MKDFFRLAAAVPETRVGGVGFNCAAILKLYKDAVAHGAAAAVFPELAVTGYTCGDLFSQERLLSAAEDGLNELAAAAGATVMIVGVPVRRGSRLFNCAAVLQNGAVRALVAKSILPNYREFYEKRQFSPACEAPDELGMPTVFRAGGLRFGVEICEDLWTVKPPSADLALAGAQVIFNPSAGTALAGKGDFRRDLVKSHSARLCAAYVLSGAGVHESTSEAVFAGHALIGVNGVLAAENRRFGRAGSVVYADVNCRWLDTLRRTETSFNDCFADAEVREIALDDVPESQDLEHFRTVRRPFVPEDPAKRLERCAEIAEIQTAALAKRMEHTGMKWVVGLSGGLDSTLALLTAAACRDKLQLPADTVRAVGMPGFGTTSRTRGNAEKLAEILHVPYRTIAIGDAVNAHFRDIGHDPAVQDVVYENAQARERTQILMDVANGCGALVLGTGDLSEIALGWSTFNGDHMSMYGVNCSVPKTLVRHMVAYYADILPEARAVLLDILDTPVSPELLPGKQYTEELIGSYELHDFFLYYFIKYGADPETLLELAAKTFAPLDRETIRPVLKKFLTRFFSQQFKRNASPDGPKVGTIALSPRSDWRMPSDATAEEWLR